MDVKKKHLTTILSLAIIAALSAGATYAYFTDTDTAKNTFTVGNVDITLDETDVDDSLTGVEENVTEEGRDKANEYHLLPGHEYTKDPTVTVLTGSEESYVRMLVNVEGIDKLKEALPKDGESTSKYYASENGKDVFLLQMLVEGWDNQTWTYAGYTESSNGTTGTYEFRYKDIVGTADKNLPLESLFDKIVVPGEIDNAHIAHLANVKIVVTAQAIQASGFASENEAWETFSK